MVDFYPFALVDIYVHYVAACRRAVLAWHYIYFGVVEAFVPVISQYVFFSLVYDVGRKLRPFLHTYAFFQVLLVAFLYAVEIYLRNSRSLVEVQVKPDFVTAHGYDFDFHVRKKTLLPETAYHVAYVVGGNSYLRPLFQAGISDKYEVLVCVFPRNCNFFDCVGTRIGVCEIRQFVARQDWFAASVAFKKRVAVVFHLLGRRVRITVQFAS